MIPHQNKPMPVKVAGPFHFRVHTDDVVGNRPKQDCRNDCTAEEPFIERPHDISAGSNLNEKGRNDRRDQADAANRHWIKQELAQLDTANAVNQRQHHCRTNGDDVGLEQIGRHTGTVANVVANVVGNHRRVAGIIFRNTGFNLANEVRTDVRAFREDTAAQTGENRNQRCTEGQANQSIDQLLVVRSPSRFKTP